MTPRMQQTLSARIDRWSFGIIIDTMPPRDPEDEEEADEDEDEGQEPADEPPVIRERTKTRPECSIEESFGLVKVDRILLAARRQSRLGRRRSFKWPRDSRSA